MTGIKRSMWVALSAAAIGLAGFAALAAPPATISNGYSTAPTRNPASPTHRHSAPGHGVASVPAALIPAVAQTLAKHAPETWRARAIAGHGVVFHNPAQHFTARFDARGLRLQLAGHPSRYTTVQLTAWRTSHTVQPIMHGAWVAKGNRIEMVRGRGLTEWYVNSPLGVEQGLTLAAAPKLAASDHTLELVFRAHGNLRPTLEGKSVEFKNAACHGVVRYGGLLAWDADHHSLPAHLLLTGDRLILRVDTRGARYPVSVDPLFTTRTNLPDPAATAGDTFGVSVALSADGTTALIGAYGTAVSGNSQAGQAYAYSQTGGVWSTTPVATFSDPAATTNDGFGRSVALSPDGTTALIGAEGTSTSAGKAYAYSQTSGAWLTTPVATFSDPAATSFDSFGSSVALSGNGTTALVGASGTAVAGNSAAGAAYVFDQTAGVWSTTPVASFSDPAAAFQDFFGLIVALSADGTTALIAAPSIPGTDGKAYAYSQTAGVWSPVPVTTFSDPAATVGDDFGFSVALSADGTTALIGAEGTAVSGNTQAGMAYAYSQTAGVWSSVPVASFSDPPATAFAAFGSSVALAANGTLALIGAEVTGNAYAYIQTGGVWSTTPAASLPNPPTTLGYFFGNSVALSADGTTALIGAEFSTPGGEAYVFTNPTVDLSLTLSGSPSIVALGGNVTYLLTVTNNDTAVTDTNLTLSDALPAAMTYVSASAAGGTCNNASGTVTCTLASLAPLATWQPTITVAANTAGSIQNTASVSGKLPDPNPANNRSTVTTLVEGPPTASDGSITTVENTAVNGTLSATGNGALTFALQSLPAHGTVTLTASSGTFTYTPALDFSGTDSFTFNVTDSFGTSNLATEMITVTAPLPPTASGGSLSTVENAAVNGTLSATGTGPLTFAVVQISAHGTVAITNASTGAFTYTPASGYLGSDSFTFTATNSAGTSNIATESITINPPLAVAPIASNGSVTTNEGVAVTGTLVASGTGPLTFSIFTQPTDGALVLNNTASGEFTYTPKAGFTGTDSFQFTASNSAGVSNTSTETVTVNAISSSSGNSSGGGGAVGGISLLLLLGLVLRARATTRP